MDARLISTVAIGVLIVVLLWDAYLTAKVSRDTMSNVITTFNQTTGGLVALAIAALWVHWFLPLPKSWISDDFRNQEAF